MVEPAQPQISIVILNYNGLEYLRKSIPNILALEFPSFEVVVIDNGSTDSSMLFLNQYPEIRTIANGKNLGYSQGKNIGVQTARGRYVLLLDDDINILEPLLLDKLLNKFTEREMGFLSLALVDSSKTVTEWYGGFYGPYGLKLRAPVPIDQIINHRDQLVEIAAPDGGELFFSLGGYDEAQPYFLDVGDIGIRSIILSGKKNYLYTRACLIHLGAARKEDDKTWCWKYRYTLSGISRIAFKNWRWENILSRFPVILGYFFIKTLKQLIIRRKIGVALSLFKSMALTLKQLPDTIKLRKKIQRDRKIHSDIFFKIHNPFSR